MLTNNNSFAETTIVAFHVGRGGHYWNAGHKSFIGQEKIGKFTSDLFIRHENLLDFKKRYGFDQTFNSDQKCISDLATEENYDELEELFGITAEMLGEIYYYDGSGSNVGLSEEDVDKGVGCIDIDGQYDTTYTCYLSDCNEEELRLIADYNGYVNSNIVDYAKEQLGEVDEKTEGDNVINSSDIVAFCRNNDGLPADADAACSRICIANDNGYDLNQADVALISKYLED